VPGDISNLADLDRLLATVKRQQGRLDVLFANAGFLALAPLGSISEEHFGLAEARRFDRAGADGVHADLAVPQLGWSSSARTTAPRPCWRSRRWQIPALGTHQCDAVGADPQR